jgi:small subunit ribosomal protein S20
MPNMPAAKKALRKSKKFTLRNKKVKESIKHLLKKCRVALADKRFDDAEKLFIEVSKAYDKAARRNIVKRNTAARKKSRLAQKLNIIRRAK